MYLAVRSRAPACQTGAGWGVAHWFREPTPTPIEAMGIVFTVDILNPRCNYPSKKAVSLRVSHYESLKHPTERKKFARRPCLAISVQTTPLWVAQTVLLYHRPIRAVR